MTINARFFSDGKTRDGKPIHKVEMQVVGDKSNVIQKVNAEHVQRFPAEWRAYESGTQVNHGGTSLMEIPGMDTPRSMELQFKGIHNAEALAQLSDGQVAALGQGMSALRRTAQLLVAANAKTEPGKKAAA